MCPLTVLSKVSLGHTCSGVGLLGPGVYIYVISQNSSRLFSRLFVPVYCSHWASVVAQLVKNPPAIGRPGFDPWVGKIPWRRGRLPTPVFWPGEFHGLYSPWGRKESDTTVFPFLVTSVASHLSNSCLSGVCKMV